MLNNSIEILAPSSPPVKISKHSVFRERLDQHLQAAVDKLAKQHSDALKLVDDFCITLEPVAKREHAEAEGLTVPGTIPQEVNSLKQASIAEDATNPLFTKRILTPPRMIPALKKAVDLPPPTGCPRSLTVKSLSSSHESLKSFASRESLMDGNCELIDSNERPFNHGHSVIASESRCQLRRNTVTAAAEALKDSAAMSKKFSTEDGKRHVFVDASAMKEQVKKAIMKPEYDVKNYYSRAGVWQRLARNPIFEYLTLAIISANSIWIAIDTDHNREDSLLDANPVFFIGENFFCVYFTVELVIRFMAFADKKNCVKDAWFVFDAILVLLMVFETWVMTVILASMTKSAEGETGYGNASLLRLVRLLRLTRMARMARLLRVMPELMILVKGIAAATRSVFFTLCLLVVLIYVYSVAFVQLTAEMEDSELHDNYFKKVPLGMHSLLLHLVLPDQADLIEEVGQDSWILAALLLIFVLLSTLTILNMLVGVLVEVVKVVSEVEKEQMMVSFVKTELSQLLYDVDGKTEISKADFEQLLLDPRAAKIIHECGVDVVGLVDFTDHIFENGRKVTFPEFMELILDLRGSNGATVRDMVDMRKFLSNNLIDAVERIERVVKQTESVVKRGTIAILSSTLGSEADEEGNGESDLLIEDRKRHSDIAAATLRQLAAANSNNLQAYWAVANSLGTIEMEV